MFFFFLKLCSELGQVAKDLQIVTRDVAILSTADSELRWRTINDVDLGPFSPQYRIFPLQQIS